MAISKMKLINIVGDNEYLNDVLLRFVGLDYFHPEPASKIADSVHGLTTLPDENPIIEVLNRFNEICSEMELTLPAKKIEGRDYDIEHMKEYVSNIYRQFQDGATVQRELEKVIQENKDALVQVKNIENIDLSLDDLFECEYIKIRFGRLPLDSVEKLQYYRNRPFVFKSFNKDDSYSWCAYFTTSKYEGDVDNIFSSLYFERIRIPDFVHGKPEFAKESLQEEIDSDYQQLGHVNDIITNLKKECFDEFTEIKAELEFLNYTFEARKYVVGLGERFSITGFVVIDDVDKLKEMFRDLKEVDIEVRPAHSDKRLSPPTKLKNGWFARPFSMFVEMYGIPEYSDFDPTPFVAITYTLLFGIMFGDLGQGIVLSLFCYVLNRRKKSLLAQIGMRIGIASAFFGTLYGSVFGNEHILNPLYQTLFGLKEKPIDVMGSDFIMPLLGAAVGIGVILIITSISFQMFLNYKHKRYGELLFSQNGVAGLVFYISLVGGAVVQLLFGIKVLTLPYVLILIILPLVLVFFKEPLTRKMEHKELYPDGVGGFVLETSFEVFEIFLSFVTNTISYLRVAGFVLSHAGLMLAVTLIMEMAGGAGIFVGIFGNIFVMVLEGMIVGIQVLRLEFYEMFSRYFEGNGIMFKTLKD